MHFEHAPERHRQPGKREAGSGARGAPEVGHVDGLVGGVEQGRDGLDVVGDEVTAELLEPGQRQVCRAHRHQEQLGVGDLAAGERVVGERGRSGECGGGRRGAGGRRLRLVEHRHDHPDRLIGRLGGAAARGRRHQCERDEVGCESWQ